MSPACPPKIELSNFLKGDLQPPRWDDISDHVDSCSECQTQVENLTIAPDTIVSALADNRDTSPFSSEVECHEAVGAIGHFLARKKSERHALGDDATAPLAITEIGSYRILRKLGEGGMGAVYEAVHRELDMVVAIKILPEERTRDKNAVARFRREIKAAGRIRHPNIVQATDAGEVDGVHFLVMERVDGVDLSKLVRRTGPLPVEEGCEIARQTAVGLQAAADHELVHRDIKPSNLMLNSDGQVKILDLGLARLFTQEAVVDELTREGVVVGTADYMSPEQVSAPQALDIRSDIYSLGCTLYRLLTGETPYSGPRYSERMNKLLAHVNDPVPDVRTKHPEIPRPLATVVETMLAKKPADRFESPAAVAAALGPFAAEADLRSLYEIAKTLPEVEPEQRHKSTVSCLAGPETATVSEKYKMHRTKSGAGSHWWMDHKVIVGAGFLGLLILAAVIYVVTDKGTLEIKSEDPDVQVVVRPDGAVNLRDGKTNKKVPIPYEHQLSKGKGGLRLSTDSFQLSRGKKKIVDVKMTEGPPGSEVPKPLVGTRTEIDGKIQPILEYRFNETGTAAASTGSDTTPVELFDIKTTSADRHTPDQDGVSGRRGDRAFDNTEAVSHGVFTDGGIARHAADNQSIDGLRSFTLSGWLKPVSTIENNAAIFANQDTASEPDRGFTLSAGVAGTLQLQMFSTSGKGVATSNAAYTDTDWFFFAVTYDGTLAANNVRFYIGTKTGKVVQVGAAQTINNGAVVDETKCLSIGNYTAPMSDARFPNRGPLDALLDNMRIFGSKTDGSGALSLADLDELRRGDLR